MSDNLTAAQRSYCMSKVRNKRTSLERIVEQALRRKQVRYRRNHSALPGSPDFVIESITTAVFVDGDFWHGYQFPKWKHNLSSFWQTKIERNRKRDKRSHAALRRLGWRVVRLWQHQVETDLTRCLERILD
jgi:DNA mismatch endonuclease (patch repair protein)